MNVSINFIKEVVTELSETSWPTLIEMRKHSSSVFTAITLFTLFFHISDYCITWLLSLI